MTDLKAPFPWFGGKQKIASIVWSAIGDVPNYVEPFFGSGAVLLSRPHRPGIETVNDLDGFVANFWRALKHDPDAVADHADWPVNETDLHARHYWLVTTGAQTLLRIQQDPDAYDAKIAGWWVWGLCAWIGGGWCSGKGPWQAAPDGWQKKDVSTEQGIKRKLPHLGCAGQGINRKTHEGRRAFICNWFNELSDRLRGVRVAQGDWSRVCGPSVTTTLGTTGIFFDPPYASDRDAVYNQESFTVAKDVEEWCRNNGDNPKLRIVLAGYQGDYDLPGWRVHAWKANGGYGSQSNKRGRDNAAREVLLLSPHCLNLEQSRLL